MDRQTLKYKKKLDDAAHLLRRIKALEEQEKELSKQLRISETLNSEILNALPINIFLEDREGRTLFANEQACRSNGKKFEELDGKTVFDFFPPSIAEKIRNDDLEVWRKRELITKEIIVGFQGEESYMFSGKTIIHSNESDEDFLLGFGLDITDRVKAEQLLRESEEKFRNLVDQAADCFFLIGADGELINVNSMACELLGYKQDELLGLNANRIFPLLPGKIKMIIEDSGEQVSCQFEDLMLHKNMAGIPADINLRMIEIGERQLFLALCRDIRDRKKSEARIHHMAYHDAITGLPNRWFIKSWMTSFFKRENPTKLAVLLLDLDHFKVINDSMGHHAGDLLLQDVAARLQKVKESGYILARFGGDEFIILIPDIQDVDEANKAGEKIIGLMEKAFLINGQKLTVTTSIGISISPDDGDEMNTLIKNADLAMYKAKELGRNCTQLFNPSMMTFAVERMDKEILIRQALEKNEFLLHYQPKFNIQTGEIFSMEALIRWRNKDDRLLYPNEFISVAEETGLIVPIGEWVIREACRQCREWHDAGFNNLTVSVNLSPQQFQKQNLEALISKILQETGLPPNALELELTEGTVMKEPENASIVLGHLKSIGIEIAIDDFGTGFSSLSYLRHFPIDVLKIDKSFIINLEVDNANASIAAAVISLAHSLNLKVVAEGVETEEQLRFLESHACDFAQGYYISKPMEPEAVGDFIKKTFLPV